MEPGSPRVLAIDTTAGACSAALGIAGQRLHRCVLTPREHSRRLLGMVRELLDEAGVGLSSLDAVAFGAGPGSFTGVRIATGVAQGLAYGAGLPLIPVSSLALLAQGQLRALAKLPQEEPRSTCILVCFDARMGELYWGSYRGDANGLVRALRADALDPPARLQPATISGATQPAGNPLRWIGAGSGFAAWPELAERLRLETVDAAAQPLARDALPLAERAFADGQLTDPAAAVPAYLRNRVAEPPAR